MPRTTLLAVLLVALFVAVAPVAGEDAKRAAAGFAVLGHGNKSCGEVLQDENKQSVARIANNVWVNGYLTAKNSMATVPDLTKGMSQADMEARLLAFCSKHPEGVLVDAAVALEQEERR